MIHGKQFAILRERQTELEGFRHLPLENGWILSYHESLPVAASDDRSAVLLGQVWQLDASAPSPQTQIRELDPALLLKAEEDWCGRYVLILNGAVLTDTLGLLGVFRSEAGEAASDVSLLTEEKSAWRPEEPLCCFPGPGTPWPGIRRLLPSQRFDLYTGRVTPRPMLAESWLADDPDVDRLTGALADRFASALRSLGEAWPDRKPLLALTGGYDSRVVLAAAKRAGLTLTGVTLERDGMSDADLQYPERLCGLLGWDYRFIRRDPSRFSAERFREYDEQVAGLLLGEDQLFHAFGQYQELTELFGDAMLLRGGVLGGTKSGYAKYVGETPELREVLQFLEVGRRNTAEKASLAELLRWFEEAPQRLAYPNRLYLEQRVGSWLAEIEHGFDLYDRLTSFQIGNCRSLFTLLMQYPFDMRAKKAHHVRLIEAMCPELLSVPFENKSATPGGRGRQLLDKLKTAERRIGRLGVTQTAELYGRLLRSRR